MTDTNEMTCGTAQRQITAYADGELAQEEAAALLAHLAHCDVCTSVLEQIGLMKRVLPTWCVVSSPVEERVEARIRAGATLEDAYRDSLSETPDTPDSRDIGRLLVERATISHEQLGIARAVQSDTRQDLGQILIALGFATEREVTEAHSLSAGVPFIDLVKHKPEPSALQALPAHVARKHNALPVKKDGQRLWMAMKNPRDAGAIDELRVVSRCMVQPMAAVPSDLERAMEEAYGTIQPVADVTLRQVLTEMRSLLVEVHALRGEVQTLREELAESRRQNVTRGNVLRIASSSRGSGSVEPLPYAPPSDAPLPLS